MKALFSILTLLAISSATLLQAQSTVTINTTGTRNKQVVVDSKSYTIDNTTTTAGTQSIVITDLAPGQHTLGIVRNANRNVSSQTNFTVRDGYDLTITVSTDGSISSAEKRVARGGNNAGGQLSAAAYNKLYTQTKAKVGSAARTTFLETEFNNSAKKFTSKQSSQLIQLVNTESLRLRLAKLFYPRISDQQNFALVSDLLKSTANRNELNIYIASVAGTETGTVDGTVNATTPISGTNFTIIYNEVSAEPTINDRVFYLNNFFSRDFNFYTSAQAKQLIQLVSGEQERFDIMKTAYRGITDKENYSVVYPLLMSASNRAQLISYINTYDDNNPRQGISTASFDKLYQSVYAQNSSASRYTSVNNAFITSGNYFTVAQARKLITLVSAESSRLQLSKTVYSRLVDRSNYSQLNDLLASAASRNDFNNYVLNYNNTSAGVGVAMSETDFNKLYQNVNNSWSNTSRVSLVADAFRISTNFFTTYQVRQLLTLINAENDRLTLAKSAYDNTIDPNNYTQLYDLFTSTSSKNDLAAFVSNIQNGTATTIKVPMTDAEFKNIYSNIQFTFGIGAKYSALTEIFNTETNYFTVAQAKQLIQMVSSESNRLELAKSSYNNITDPSNFSQVYDIFSSQASKNELMAYVNSNAYNN